MKPKPRKKCSHKWRFAYSFYNDTWSIKECWRCGKAGVFNSKGKLIEIE